MKICHKCNKPIPPERLEVFPLTTECVVCSSAKPKFSLMFFDCKTNGSIVSIDGANTEGIRQAKRAYRRAR